MASLGTLPPVQAQAERRADLARMKRNATGLLVAVTAVWVALLVLTEDTGGAGYAIAAAEAAMVGGLADWFAVTAIFRHPLGLPIPHTAVVAARKDQFGVTLGEFVQENFLSAGVVGDRLATVDLAGRAGRWLAQPDNAAVAAGHAAELAVRLAQGASDDDVVTLIERQVRQRVERVEAAPLAARGLRLLTTEGHHEALLDEVLATLDGFLVRTQPALRERFTAESPWWLPEALDDALFTRLFDGVRNVIGDAATPAGPGGLRAEIHRGIQRFVDDLEHDPELAARAEALKQDLLGNEELRRWIDAMWREVKGNLRTDALDDTSALRQRLAATVVGWGARLAEDPEVHTAANQMVIRTARSAVDQFSAEISGLVSSTVSGWDSEETADRLELLLGRDLQFIRINGTVVGGVAGLVIHAISQLAG